LTNTYPDHEDIQGPAGINIPQVMTNFITTNGTLVTSEEQMYPYILPQPFGQIFEKKIYTKPFGHISNVKEDLAKQVNN
jgi:hypothetical protein